MNTLHLFARASFVTLLGAGGIFAAEAPKVEAPKTIAPATTPAATTPTVKSGTAPVVMPGGVRVGATAPKLPTYEANFALIGDRNIFNPNRVGRSSRPPPDAPRGDVITFVGVMDYAKGLTVFFDSPDRNYNKALHDGGKLGPYVVKNIGPDSVDLLRDSKTITLKVGQQLRRPVGGDWTVISADIVSAEARAAETAAAMTNATAPIAIPPNASEALRRLMEARQNQLKQ